MGMSPLLFTFITNLLILPFATNTKHSKIVTKLIHRHSIFSPSYNTRHSINDQADRTLKNSISRLNFLHSKRKTNLLHSTYEADIPPDKHMFIVNLLIGQPPIPQLVAMDTGSSLLWVQCKPCKAWYPQKGPLYDSSTSSPYTNISCHVPFCYYITDVNCDNNCIYKSSYVDGSKTKGMIGTEQLTFQTHDEGVIVVPNVVFGSGQENKINSVGRESGILGLGTVIYGIVQKLGLKFSYCIGSIYDSSYNFNVLTLGEDVLSEGNSTPFDEINDNCYIILEGISLGEEKLDIDPNVFKSGGIYGGTVIDSGCELTFLQQDAYSVLESKVSKILDGFLKLYDNRNGELCYVGKLRQDLTGFPAVTLHFAVLDIESTFYQRYDNVFCMASVRIESNSPSVVRVLAQQYYNVVYDLNERRIYFQRVDCQLHD